MSTQLESARSWCGHVAAVIVTAGVLAAGAHAAPPTSSAAIAGGDNATALARYNQEKAACQEGRSHQDKATCLKDATNAYDEARRRPATTQDRSSLNSNALARCANVLPADKLDCEKLALGQGKTSGSVEGGGVIKELRTVEPAPATPR